MKKVRRAKELEEDWGMGLQDLLGEVTEANWLLYKLWQSVVDIHQEVHGMAHSVKDIHQEVCGIG